MSYELPTPNLQPILNLQFRVRCIAPVWMQRALARALRKLPNAPPVAPSTLSAHGALEYCAAVGLARGGRPLRRVFAASVAGGALLSLSGALVANTVGMSPSLDPGMAKLLAAAVFPSGWWGVRVCLLCRAYPRGSMQRASTPLCLTSQLSQGSQ